jgi:hypothetical protein
VTVRSGRDDGNVVGVLDGGEDSGSEDELLPGLADVEDVDTWGLAGSRQEGFHSASPVPESLVIRSIQFVSNPLILPLCRCPSTVPSNVTRPPS